VYPRQDVLANYAPGQPVPLRYEALAHTDQEGRFQLKVDPSTLPSQYISARGQVDVDVLVDDGAQSMTWSTSCALTNRAAKTWRSIPGSLSRVSEPVFDLGESRVRDAAVAPESIVDTSARRLDLKDMADFDAVATAKSSRMIQAAETHLATEGRSAAAAPSEICIGSWGIQTATAQETWANIYGRAAPWSVTLRRGNDHTLGIEAGGKAAGTRTISSDMSSSTVAANASLKNTVQYRYWSNSCQPFGQMRPYKEITLLSTSTRIAPYDYSHCTIASAGVTYTKSTAKNITIKGGVTVKGVALSAQSGWDGEVQMSMKPSRDAWICGSASSDWTSSPSVSNKPR
jgi:hypothetical protein